MSKIRNKLEQLDDIKKSPIVVQHRKLTNDYILSDQQSTIQEPRQEQQQNNTTMNKFKINKSKIEEKNQQILSNLQNQLVNKTLIGTSEDLYLKTDMRAKSKLSQQRTQSPLRDIQRSQEKEKQDQFKIFRINSPTKRFYEQQEIGISKIQYSHKKPFKI